MPMDRDFKDCEEGLTSGERFLPGLALDLILMRISRASWVFRIARSSGMCWH